MNITTLMIIKLAVAIFVSFFAGPAAVWTFNKMPAKWLCDWNEKPSQELLDPNVKRIKENPWRWVFAAGFICLSVRLMMSDLGEMSSIQSIQLTAVGLPLCWILLVIALADYRFMIIPDQMVMLLIVMAIGRVNFISSIKDPLIGAAMGGGSLLIVAGLGALISKKEVLGFGDVKLSAALGMVLGIKGIIVVLIVAIMLSGVKAALALARKRKKASDMMPLGPYICGSAMAYILICWPFGL